MPNDPSEIFDKIKLFFSQQAELYGDEMFVNYQSTINDEQSTVVGDQKKEVEKISRLEHDSRRASTTAEGESHQGRKSGSGEDNKAKVSEQKQQLRDEREKVAEGKTIKVSEERGLFDNAIVKPEWKIDPKWYESGTIEILNSKISSCLKCSLGSTRKNFVFGVGNPKAKLVLIGEAPGADEDEQGEPFVGRAGQLLNKILAAVQLRREDVYICNILKCRPPNNRDPLPDEAEACEPFLKKQLEVINPKLILCLGRIAGQTLLKTNASLSELRNNVYVYQGIKVLVTFHPAALLRNPGWKKPTWDDIQKMRKMYDEL